MTLEERTEAQERWTSYQKVFAEHMTTVAMNMAAFMRALARQSEENAQEHRKFEQGLEDRRELIDRHIRFRGNGNPAGN